MITIDQIAALAAACEAETLEFKKTIKTLRYAIRKICSFLNQSDGQVVFGVTPTGVVVGQQVSERTIEELYAVFRQIDIVGPAAERETRPG